MFRYKCRKGHIIEVPLTTQIPCPKCGTKLKQLNKPVFAPSSRGEVKMGADLQFKRLRSWR